MTLYGLFCKFFPSWGAFFCIFNSYICTYFWWLILYTYLFLVTYFIHKDIFDVCSVHIPYLGDLFCTLGSFDSLFCTHTSSFWSKFYVPLFHDLVCTLGNFTAYFVYLFLLGELIFTFYGYMCTYFWWSIVYTYLLLVNQSVRMEFLTAYSLYIPLKVDQIL